MLIQPPLEPPSRKKKNLWPRAFNTRQNIPGATTQNFELKLQTPQFEKDGAKSASQSIQM
jgi:hypothetical protein